MSLECVVDRFTAYNIFCTTEYLCSFPVFKASKLIPVTADITLDRLLLLPRYY